MRVTVENISLNQRNVVELKEPILKQQEIYTKSPIINKGKQNKHIEGTNEFKTAASSGDRRSILKVSLESLISQIGQGNQVGKIEVGLAGSKERINFKKIIGDYIDKDTDTGKIVSTTNGIVHYGKNDIHIVPSRPD